MAGQDQQYKIVEAFITADRFLEKEIEVSGNIFEIIIYEDLESAWLTGSVIITDDTGIFSKISFKGTEYLTLRISGAEENSESIIDKTFLLYALTKTVKVNDTSSTYNFEMIEPHAYVSALKPFSRAYTGSLERTITQILNSELNKTVDLSYLTNSISAQGERKYIVPYLTPLEACEVLVDRTTTQFGSPFFLYSSIHDNNLRLGDLDAMLVQEAFNKKIPYTFSQAATNASTSLDPASASTTVSHIDFGSPVDSLTQVEEGVYGSFYTNTDVATGISYRSKITIKNVLENMQANEIIDPSAVQDVYDENQQVQDRAIEDFNSIYWHQVTSSNMYPDYRTYHDDISNADFSLKIKNNIIRQALLSNMITIVVPGIAFLISKATVGDRCRLNVLSSEEGTEKIYDNRWTGDYLVYRTKHVFRETKHLITCEMTKLNRLPEAIS